MAKKLIKQINRLKIFRDTNRPKRGEYYVQTPDGRVLEEFSKLPPAEKWAKTTLDFVVRPRRNTRKPRKNKHYWNYTTGRPYQ